MTDSTVSTPIRRTAVLVVGVFVLQVLFIASYTGALHKPTPHHVPIAVVGPPPVAGPARQQLAAAAKSAFDLRTLPSTGAARQQLRTRHIYAAYVPNPRGRTDTLLVASAASSAVEQLVREQLGAAVQKQGRSLQVRDVIPVQSSDPRGLAGFYTAVGWVVGGYLVAALLGLLRGSSPDNRRLGLARTATFCGFGVAGGLVSALILGPATDIITGHTLALAGLGMLTTAGVAMATAAAESLLGIAGIGLAILVFVVLGNPSSGGPYAYELLPGFWRAVGPWLPPGAATTAIRNVVYFDGNALAQPIGVLVGYLVLGTAIFLAVTELRIRRAAAR
ncbi:MAG TPA: hypothetical protein VHC49_09800 [Mycobacteriales bacterium]|nr:hypothetical protein [Mycobacteriales bacterium]